MELVVIFVCMCSPVSTSLPIHSSPSALSEIQVFSKDIRIYQAVDHLEVFFMEMLLLEPSVPVWTNGSLRMWCIPVTEESSFSNILAIPCISFSWILHLPLFFVDSLVWWNTLTKELSETGNEGYF